MKKKIIAALFAVVLILSVIVPGTVIFAEEADLSVHYSRLNDMEGLLDDAAAQRVSARLDEVRRELDFDIVIVTGSDLGGKTMEEYADDFYDYNGFGCGSNRDGALLLLNMEDRKWHISTRGYGITAFTDYGIQQAGDAIKEYFDTDCEKAFDLFIDKCEEYVNLAREGKFAFAHMDTHISYCGICYCQHRCGLHEEKAEVCPQSGGSKQLCEGRQPEYYGQPRYLPVCNRHKDRKARRQLIERRQQHAHILLRRNARRRRRQLLTHINNESIPYRLHGRYGIFFAKKQYFCILLKFDNSAVSDFTFGL